MPRPKKEGQYLNIRIDQAIYDTLSRYADDKGQTKTVAVERILKEKFEAEGITIKKNIK